VGVYTYNLVVVPKSQVTDVTKRVPVYAEWLDSTADEAGDAHFKSLTREEAQALREQMPQIAPFQVVAAQAGVGLVLVLLGWMVWGWGSMTWSLLYGVAAAVVPSGLLARGAGSLSGAAALVLAVRFLAWEFVKIAVAILMLGMAAAVVPNLSWPALLAGMVVCIKVHWLALLWRGRIRTRS
jgi:ATP synthase protein I